MSRIWKEPYTEEKAEDVGIRTGSESYLLLGNSDSQWIYYVHVCSFTFAFYSLTMMQEYRNYYDTKILPSRRRDSIWVGEPQSHFNRLPLRLRDESKRHRIVKAFTKALHEFCK